MHRWADSNGKPFTRFRSNANTFAYPRRYAECHTTASDTDRHGNSNPGTPSVTSSGIEHLDAAAS